MPGWVVVADDERGTLVLDGEHWRPVPREDDADQRMPAATVFPHEFKANHKVRDLLQARSSGVDLPGRPRVLRAATVGL